jgi:(1->4)-alpha-D-glucan 1-alpha-D-glucosylmutase
MGERWQALVDWWHALCGEHTHGDGPDAIERVYVLQTLVGAWPIARERLDRHLVKAMREAKGRTSWVAPDEGHERAVVDTVQRATEDARFAETFGPFVAPVVEAAERIALGELVLRCTVPGVPDVYQGDELWNHLLVDPDNRRPVDWDVRRLLLDHSGPGQPVDRTTAKLFALRTLLRLRVAHAAFDELDYVPLRAPDDICAFARGRDPVVVAVTPVRPAVSHCDVDDLGVDREGQEWVDVLAPLAAAYGERRPAVFVRDDAISERCSPRAR